jgi:transcriptional regulator with XRE-family HTH domain
MNANRILEQIFKLNTSSPDEPEVPPTELVAFFVRFVRGLRNWKQATLASFAEVSLSTIERVERGEPVSKDSLDKIGVALGYEPGYLTAPRLRLSEEEATADFADKFKMMEPVSVQPLRTHSQIRQAADCEAFLFHRPDVGADYDDDLRELFEWIDLTSFIIHDHFEDGSSEKGRRRELYDDVLSCAQRIEQRGTTILFGVMHAPRPAAPDRNIGVISVTLKSSDPGAMKRRVIFVDRRNVM